MDWSVLDIVVSVLALLFGIFGLREGFGAPIGDVIYVCINDGCFVCGISRVIGIFGESFSRLEYCKSHCTGIIGAIFAVDWPFCFY